MTTQNQIVNVSVKGMESLNKLNASVDKMSGHFSKLKGLVAGIGLAAFAKSALNLSSDLSDLSSSSGFATAKILELKQALSEAGGEPDKVSQSLNKFLQTLDDAVNGSATAQSTFLNLGISLDDLRKLTDKELFDKSIKGLASMENASERASIKVDLFGKSWIKVSPATLAENLKNAAGKSDQYAASIENAARLNDALAKATINAKIAFLQAFGPVLEKLVSINSEIEKSGKTLSSLTTIIKVVGAVLVATFSIGVLRGFVATIGTLGRGLAAIASVSKLGSLATMLSKASRAAGPLQSALRAIAIIIGTGLGVFAASQLFDNWGDIAVNSIYRIIEAILTIAPSIAGAGIGAAIGTFIAGPLGTLLGGIAGGFAGDELGKALGIDNAIAKVRKLREEMEMARLNEKPQTARNNFAKTDPRRLDVATKEDTTVEDAYKKLRSQIEAVSGAFHDANIEIANQINLDNQMIGKSTEFQTVLKAQEDVFKRSADEIKKLTLAKANLSVAEQKAGVGKEYDIQIAKIKELAQADADRLESMIKNSQRLQAVEQIRLFSIQQQITFTNELQKLNDDFATMTLPTLEKSYYGIEAAAKAAAKAAIEAEEARVGRPLSDAEKKGFTDQALKGVNELKDATKKNYEQSRTWNTGWTQAFNDYVENATNAADQAKNAFQQLTKGMEDSIISFAKTGKFEFGNFVNSIVEMLLRSEIQSTMAKVFQANNVGSGGGNIFSGIGKILGFAAGGIIPTNGPVMVGENGPEILSGAGGRSVTPNNQLGGQTNVTYNINAVDARSFQQLVAQDPEFLYAVTLKGQRSMPGGLR